MTGPSYPTVGVSIVAYRPDTLALDRLLASIRSEVGLIVLVDNGGAAALVSAELLERITIVVPDANIGVAAGHNLAVTRIFRSGCSHALLFDQDSLPREGMIGHLLWAEEKLRGSARQVAAVGPLNLSGTEGSPAGFVRFSGCRPRVTTQADPKLPIRACRCDFLITSGTLLRREVFEAVGPFDDDLFIDNVDVEWCYRAASLGYRCFGVVDAFMEHSLGDDTIRLPFMKRRLVVHNPLRIYYMTRNRLQLYRLRHIPLGWKLADFPRMVFKLLAFWAFVAPRLDYLKASLAGIRDGIIGVGGKASKTFQD